MEMNELLTYQAISEMTGISTGYLRWLVWAEKMPPPDYKPSPKTALWRPETIEAWLKEREA